MKLRSIIITTLLLCVFSETQARAPKEIDKKRTGITFNSKFNQTVVYINPYGKIDLPGKWDKIDYNSSKTAFYFVNADSIILGISKSPISGNPDISVKGNKEFVNAYYQLEEKRAAQKGLSCKVLRDEKDYLLWQVTGQGVDEIHLIGAKNDFAFHYSNHYSRFDSYENRINMLVDLYLNN